MLDAGQCKMRGLILYEYLLCKREKIRRGLEEGNEKVRSLGLNIVYNAPTLRLVNIFIDCFEAKYFHMHFYFSLTFMSHPVYSANRPYIFQELTSLLAETAEILRYDHGAPAEVKAYAANH